MSEIREKNGTTRLSKKVGWRAWKALLALFLSIILIISDLPVSILTSIFGKDNSITKEIDALREVRAESNLTKLVVYGHTVDINPVLDAPQDIMSGDSTLLAKYYDGKLVLYKGYTGEGYTKGDINACIYAEGDLTISVAFLQLGKQSLENRILISNSAESQEAYGIYVSGKLTFSGDGKVNVVNKLTSKCTGNATKKSAGIYAGALEMKTPRLSVSTNGAEVSTGSSTEIKPLSAGIYTSGDMEIKAGTVSGVGGNVNGFDGLSAGIYADSLTISSPAKLSAYGGEAASNVNRTKVDGVRSAGIYCINTFAAAGGAQVTAVGSSSMQYSFGTYAADVTVDGENTALSSSGGNVSETVRSETEIFSTGICAVESCSQRAGTVTAKGGKGEISSIGVSSAGLCTKELLQLGGELYASGGAVTNGSGTKYVYSYGIYLGTILKNSGGYMDVSGGIMEAVGGDLIKSGGDHGMSCGICQRTDGTGDCIIGNCGIAAKSGYFIGADGAYYAKACGFSGKLTVKDGAELTAESGSIDKEKGSSFFSESMAISGSLNIEGGTINAIAHGGVRTEGIYSTGFICKNGSNAVINVHAEKSPIETGIPHTYAINSRDDFIMEEGCNAVLTLIADGTKTNDNCYNYGLYLYPAGGAECSLAGGVIDIVMNCGGSPEGGDTYGLMCGRNADICGSQLNIEMNGRDQRMLGIGSENGVGSISLSDGEINVSCNTSQGEIRDGSTGFCCALAVDTTISGGELTLKSDETDNPEIISSGITIDGSIISTSENIDGSGSGYTDDSVINDGVGGSIQYVRAVSGTRIAPPVTDIHIIQRYDEDKISSSFAGLLPEDAGEIRYVAGTAVAVTDLGEPSAHTTVSSYTVGSKNGTVSADIEATAESVGDDIILPVSIRSEGYKPVSLNLIITITDKEVTEVNISGDNRKQYGDADFTLTAVAETADEDPTVSWESSNTSVATVDADGKVSIKGTGTTKIRADYISDSHFGIGAMTLTVDPRQVWLVNPGVSDKVYDGTRDAEVNTPLEIEGVLEADVSKVSVVPGRQLFADKNAGSNKDVYFDNYKLGPGSGGDASANYVLELPANVKANISPKAVTATVTAVDREYEKNNLTVALTAGTLNGVIYGDIVSVDLSEAVGTMADDAAGENKAVTVNGVKLSGADEANYILISQPEGVTVSIGAVAHVHEWGEWIVIKEATATEKGLKRRVCRTDASHVEEEEIPVKSELEPEPEPEPEEPVHAHAMVHHENVAATEESEGSIEYWDCSECGKLFKDAEGKTEISLADTVIPKLPNPTTVLQRKQTESVTESINGMPVSVSLNIVYPEAVSWTGARITKSQLEALSENDGIVKANFNGLEEALKGKMKEDTDVSKLVSVIYTTSKDKNAGTKGYFTLKVKLNSKAVKKAKIKGADKKELNALVKKLNEQLKNDKYEYDIVPIKLSEAESITIKAKLKKGSLQLDEQNKLKGLKSVKIKVQIKGLKKAKSFNYSAKKAGDMFAINVTDAEAKTAGLSAMPGKGFKGSRSGITITK